MAVTLQPYALTTLDRVLSELDLDTSTIYTGNTAKYDSLLNGYINAASGWLAARCSRAFQAKNAIDEFIAGNGRTKIRVARPPIVSVTSVKLDDAPVTVTDDWIIDDAAHGVLYRRVGWTWSAAVGPGLDTAGIPGEEKRNIEVVYNGGFVTRAQNAVGGVAGDLTFVGMPITLPDEIEDAIILLVSSRWLGRGRDTRVQAQSFERSGLSFYGKAVPPEVAAIVAEYAVIAHAVV